MCKMVGEQNVICALFIRLILYYCEQHLLPLEITFFVYKYVSFFKDVCSVPGKNMNTFIFLNQNSVWLTKGSMACSVWICNQIARGILWLQQFLQILKVASMTCVLAMKAIGWTAENNVVDVESVIHDFTERKTKLFETRPCYIMKGMALQLLFLFILKPIPCSCPFSWFPLSVIN